MICLGPDGMGKGSGVMLLAGTPQFPQGFRQQAGGQLVVRGMRAPPRGFVIDLDPGARYPCA